MTRGTNKNKNWNQNNNKIKKNNNKNDKRKKKNNDKGRGRTLSRIRPWRPGQSYPPSSCRSGRLKGKCERAAKGQ